MFVHIPIYELVVMFVILENSFDWCYCWDCCCCLFVFIYIEKQNYLYFMDISISNSLYATMLQAYYSPIIDVVPNMKLKSGIFTQIFSKELN